MEEKTTKRYYWLKLKENFFEEKYVRALRKLPQGDSLVIVYLKMQLKSLKTEGIIKYEQILPDAISELSLFLDEDETIVRLTVNALIKFGVIERWNNDTLYMVAMQKLIGSETAGAERVRRHRELKNQREKAELNSYENNQEMLRGNTCVTSCNTSVTKCNTEIEIDKEIELDNNPLYPPYEGEEVVENIPDSNVTRTCNSNVTSCNADVTQDEPPHKRGRKKITHFVKPTEEEVLAYCNERRNGINAAEFVAFYESKGWRVGNQLMKDWKAAVRTWEIRKREKNPQMSSAEADKLNERLINLSPDDI